VTGATATPGPSLRPPTAPNQRGRTALVGILSAVGVLIPLTLLFTHISVHRASVVLFYLLVVALTTKIGGLYAAVTAALTATVIVDYWFTVPRGVINPLDLDVIVFAAGAIGTIALTLHTTGNIPRNTPEDVTAAVDEALRVSAGAWSWSAVYATATGESYAIHAPHQGPAESAQQLADGVHGLTCQGCDRCEAAVV
jgi:two-component system, OmpR family, sensor histidine kinase KdpD